jgi:hypothetical protein
MERIDKIGLAKIYGRKRGGDYAVFLNNYLEESGGDYQTTDKYQEQLLLKRTEIDTQTIIQLQTLSRVAEDKCPEEVKKARQKLEDFFNYKCGNLLKMGGYFPLYFGSIQYGDPRNLDADVLIVKQNPLQNWEKQLFSIWGDNLIEWWQSQGLYNLKLMNEPHLTAVSLAEMSSLKKRYLYDFTWGYVCEIETYSEAFSGKPVFKKDLGNHKSAQEKILKFLSNNPLDRVIFNQSLQECLSIRISRQ